MLQGTNWSKHIVFHLKRVAVRRRWAGSKDEWLQDADWSENFSLLSKRVAVRRKWVGSRDEWVNDANWCKHFSSSTEKSGRSEEIDRRQGMNGSRMQIGPKASYVLRNEWQFKGNGSVQETNGSRRQIGPTSISSETSGSSEETAWFQGMNGSRIQTGPKKIYFI